MHGHTNIRFKKIYSSVVSGFACLLILRISKCDKSLPSFLDTFEKVVKSDYYLRHMSVRVEKLAPHWMYSYEILYTVILRNFVVKSHVFVKLARMRVPYLKTNIHGVQLKSGPLTKP